MPAPHSPKYRSFQDALAALIQAVSSCSDIFLVFIRKIWNQELVTNKAVVKVWCLYGKEASPRKFIARARRYYII